MTRSSELGHEGIADLLDDAAPVVVHGGLQDGVVVAHDVAHLGVLELGQERRRGDHVGEEDGAEGVRSRRGVRADETQTLRNLYLEALAEQGVLALTAGPKVLRLLPPLVITEEEIEQVVETLDEVLRR